MKKHHAEAAKPVRPSHHPLPRAADARASGPEPDADAEWNAPLDTRAAPAAADAAGEPGEMAADLQPVRFGLFNPEARDVCLAGSFNGWDPRAHPLQRDSLGDWSIELALPPGEHRYRLIVDGEWCDDPAAQRLVANPFGGFDALIQV